MAPNETTPPNQNLQTSQPTPQPAAEAQVGVRQTPAYPASTPAQPVEQASPKTSAAFIVPLEILSKADVGHSLRELEDLDEFFRQAAIRGAEAKNLPKLSLGLESIAAANKFNLLVPEHRTKLKAYLISIRTKAPVVHISFPSESSNDFQAKLLDWFRTQVHPHILLHIGLQPELAAGFTLRTTNKMFDFSFRKRFEKSKQMLIAALEASS